MANHIEDKATDWPVGTVDENNSAISVQIVDGIKAWTDSQQSFAMINPPPSNLILGSWSRIDDNTVQLESGEYTVDSLTSSLSIPTLSLLDKQSIDIVDTSGNVSAAKTITITVLGVIEYTDINGNSQTDTSGLIILDSTGLAIKIIRAGNAYRVIEYGSSLVSGNSSADITQLQTDVDTAEAAIVTLQNDGATDAELATAEAAAATARTALISAQAAVDATQDAAQTVQNNRLTALEALHQDAAAILPATPGDTTQVFNWNTTSPLQIEASDFYVTEDPASTTPLTEIAIDDGETKRLYLVGDLKGGTHVAGIEFDLTRTGNAVAGTLIDQVFKSNETDYTILTYNDLDESNANVGLLSQAMIDYIFDLNFVTDVHPATAGDLINNLVVNGPTGIFRNRVSDPTVSDTPITSNAAGTDIVLGMDLTEHAGMFLEVDVYDSAGDKRTWGITKLNLDKILADFAANPAAPGHGLIHTFSNAYVQIKIIDPATGLVNLRSVNRDMTFNNASLLIDATMVSTRVGMREWGPTGRTPAEGYLAMTGIVTNGAVDYPVAASRNPVYITANGLDFDFSEWDGAFPSNLGLNRDAEGARQGHQQQYIPNAPVGTAVNSGGGSTVRGRSDTGETRPTNVAEQLYMIVDTYKG